MSEFDSARRFWDLEVQTPTHNSWMAHPLVRDYINESISGPGGGWPLDWFQRTYPRSFPKGLSIGCGTGALERDAIRRGICSVMEGLDASDVSLGVARAEGEKEGMVRLLTYRAVDFNDLDLPTNAYDIIFFHQSLHHVSRVERLLRKVHAALREGGVLYLDEFVGPSRTYWNERRIAWYRALYQMLPRPVRYFDEFAMPVQYDDLSEALRSGEIVSRLKIGFRIRHVRGYGGNVLAMMFPDLDVPRLPSELVATLITAEKSLLASGVEPFHAVIVAEAKQGLTGVAAGLRYLAEPKIGRLRREWRTRFTDSTPNAPEEDRFRT